MIDLLKNLPEGFVTSALTGQIRGIMTALAGAAITYHLLVPADEASFVRISTGIAVGAVGLLWSAWQKSGHSIQVSIVKKSIPATVNVT